MIRRVPFTDLARAHSGELIAPLDEDLQPLRWEWINTRAAERVYTTTAAELLDLWLPGYLAASSRTRLEARIEHAAATRAQLAATLVEQAESGSAAIDPAARAVLLGSSWEPPDLLEWAHPVPLVLLDVFYVPYTSRPAPRSAIDGDVAEPSNLLWLRPSSETAYLRSLATAGVVQLAEHVG